MNELIEAPPASEPWICPKCTGVRGAHYLTCPLLRLGAGRVKDLEAAANGPRLASG